MLSRIKVDIIVKVAAVPSVLTCACLADLAMPVRACLVDYVRVLLSVQQGLYTA